MDALDCPIEKGLDALEVWQELPQCLSNDLGTGAALDPGHTAPFVFISGDGTFAANFTCFSHDIDLSNF